MGVFKVRRRAEPSKLNESVVIDAAPSTVWRVVADVRRIGEWSYARSCVVPVAVLPLAVLRGWPSVTSQGDTFRHPREGGDSGCMPSDWFQRVATYHERFRPLATRRLSGPDNDLATSNFCTGVPAVNS